MKTPGLILLVVGLLIVVLCLLSSWEVVTIGWLAGWTAIIVGIIGGVAMIAGYFMMKKASEE